MTGLSEASDCSRRHYGPFSCSNGMLRGQCSEEPSAMTQSNHCWPDGPRPGLNTWITIKHPIDAIASPSHVAPWPRSPSSSVNSADGRHRRASGEEYRQARLASPLGQQAASADARWLGAPQVGLCWRR